MSIDSDLTDDDQAGDAADDNRGNRIELSEEEKSDSTKPPDIEDHPYQLLTPDVVIDAVESTGRLSDARILALNSYENRVYQVGMDVGEPVIAKFYRPDRWSIEQIMEEHRFTQQLYDLEIPVVPPLVIDEGSDTPTLSHFNNFDFSIYPRQGGRAPELDNLDHLHQLGQFIGRIHAVGAVWPFKHRLSLRVQAFGYDSVAYLLENNFIPGEVRPAYESIVNEVLVAIEKNSPESSEYDVISLHGDCHPGNILWRNDRPHFVDFDDAITGPAIQDLWMLLSGDTAYRQRQLSEIVEGYEVFREFNLRELKLIEPLRALRVLNYNAWLAKRWHDPAFPLSFPWFNTPRYWSEHILELKELLTSLHEPALAMPDQA
jgi:Ser/Thr protein kinase RdoA (MazF antagonist)